MSLIVSPSLWGNKILKKIITVYYCIFTEAMCFNQWWLFCTDKIKDKDKKDKTASYSWQTSTTEGHCDTQSVAEEMRRVQWNQF